jgi:transcriptional regulator with XRE-family HTH domain
LDSAAADPADTREARSEDLINRCYNDQNMNNSQKLLQIRNKKMGLLIFDARKSSRREVSECAEAIGVSPEQFAQFESGSASPSLPQLELLALFFNLPIEHFWGKRAISETGSSQVLQEKERLILLRNRVIGTNIRLSRNNANISLQELAEKTGIAPELINRYELGELPVPVIELELLASALGTELDKYYDEHGPIGRWRAQQGSLQKFFELPPDVQQFVAKPVNRPYIEVAMRLSELSAEKLRAVAEVLLEITY